MQNGFIGERFVLNRSLLITTFRCNNRCEKCGVMSPYYDKPPHYSLMRLSKILKQYFQTVDYVEKFTLSGGEPFLHPELAELVLKISKYVEQFGKLQIITNGRQSMPDDLVNALKQLEKSELLIDDYGINTDACRILERQAKENDIAVNYRIYKGEAAHKGGWVDSGSFSKRNRTMDETIRVFEDCPAPKDFFGLFIVDGVASVCFRSWYLLKMKNMPNVVQSDQYVDLMEDISIEEKRQRIQKMLYRREPYGACGYCSGQGSLAPRIPAGMQIKRNRKMTFL